MLRRSSFLLSCIVSLQSACTGSGAVGMTAGGTSGANPVSGGSSTSGGSPASGASSGSSSGGSGAGMSSDSGGNQPGGGGGSLSTGGTSEAGATGSGSQNSGGSAASGGNAAGGNSGGDGTGGATVTGHTAKQAAAAMGRGVNLGQMFESTQHPRTLEAAAAKIDAYYNRGFRNVRIPITWTEPVGGDLLVVDPTVGNVDRSHPRLSVIESVIDHALSYPDLYVVINAHHEVTLKTESRAAVLQQLWSDIADVFQDKSHHLLFEILNEPHVESGDPMPSADLRNMTGLAYAEIRQIDPERLILFGGNQWFGAHEIPEVWTSLDEVGGGTDPYLMATFHHYDPWTFCGDNQGTYDDPWTEANQSDPMTTMATWAETVGGGMPVYIGEWGVAWGSRYSQLTCNNILQWYTTFDSVHAQEHNQPTAVWDDGGWFKIFDHATNNFNNNLVDCILGSCDWVGTERFNSGCL